MLIIGVLVGSVVTVGISRSESARFTANANRMDKVEEAVAGFVALNKFLPCPAPPGLALNAAGYGISDCAATCTGATNPRNLCTGMVPVVTLGISQELAFDGWGRRLLYVADQRLTPQGIVAGNGPANFRDTNPEDADFAASGPGDATINSNAAATGIWVWDLFGALRTDDAALLLLSWGPNGRCGRDRNGAVQTCAVGANTEEQENGDLDRSYQQATGRTGTFDDVVRYLDKWQLVRRAGGVLDTALCEKAARITECSTARALSGSGRSVPTGPVGCDVETSPLPTVPVTYVQHLGCTSVQMALAKKIVSLCFMDLSYVCNP